MNRAGLTDSVCLWLLCVVVRLKWMMCAVQKVHYAPFVWTIKTYNSHFGALCKWRRDMLECVYSKTCGTSKQQISVVICIFDDTLEIIISGTKTTIVLQAMWVLTFPLFGGQVCTALLAWDRLLSR